MKVLEIMSSPASACRPEDKLTTVAAMMFEQGRGALAVLDRDGRPVGIVTDEDICRAVAIRAGHFSYALVREIMTANPFTCPVTADVEEALRIMTSCRVRRLLVVDRRGLAVGVISVTDILEAAHGAIDHDIALLRRLLSSVARICRGSRGARSGRLIRIRRETETPSGLDPRSEAGAGAVMP